MSSCCSTSDQTTSKKTKSLLTVALAGNPNSGKTTIFNALTGLRQKVANYPGVTVEKKTGRCKLAGGEWAVPAAMREELAVVGGALGILEAAADYSAVAERLLIGDRSGELDAIARREPVASLLDHSTKRLAQLGIDPMQADIEAHYQW